MAKKITDTTPIQNFEDPWGGTYQSGANAGKEWGKTRGEVERVIKEKVSEIENNKIDKSDIADEIDIEDVINLVISFEDSEVESALTAAGIGGETIDGKITEYEAATVTTLGNALKGKNITTFKELRYFKGLTTLEGAFAGCSKLTTVILPKTSSVTNLKKAFYGCLALQELDLSPLSGSSIANAANMVDGAVSLTALNLTGINFASQTSDMMFNYVPALQTITGGIASVARDINLKSSPSLTHDCALAIINSLGTTSGKAIKFSSTTYATLTDGDKAIATGKGWTVSGGVALPNGYTLLKGIHNPSTAYIDTGVIPSLQVNILADMTWESGVWLYGDTKYASGVSVMLQRLSPGWRLKLGGSNTTYTANTPVSVSGERHVFQQGYDDAYPDPAAKIPFIIDGIEKAIKTGAATTENSRSHTLLIFASHGTGVASGPENPVVGDLLGFLLYDVNGNEVRNYIPVLNDSNVAGLWDQEEGRFYQSGNNVMFEAIYLNHN